MQMKKGNDVAVARENASPGLFDWFDADFARWFDMRPFFGRFDLARIEPMRIEQELTDDTLVVRAELPGIDPEKDVDITLDEGVLRIKAERRSETKEEKEGSFRSEFRYGAFERALRVPRETLFEDVKATYKDGVLEVRCPYKVPTEAPPMKVEVARG
jgi:HSP20 family protein